MIRMLPKAMSGHYWFGRRLSSKPQRALKEFKELPAKDCRKSYGLTRRELEIIREVVGGTPHKEIAARFSISEQTVKHHITSIFDKLGVSNRLELTIFAFHHRLVDPDEEKHWRAASILDSPVLLLSVYIHIRQCVSVPPSAIQARLAVFPTPP